MLYSEEELCFEEWINEPIDKDDFSFLMYAGLKPDAPPEAVEAYKAFLKRENDLRARGIKE